MGPFLLALVSNAAQAQSAFPRRTASFTSAEKLREPLATLPPASCARATPAGAAPYADGFHAMRGAALTPHAGEWQVPPLWREPLSTPAEQARVGAVGGFGGSLPLHRAALAASGVGLASDLESYLSRYRLMRPNAAPLAPEAASPDPATLRALQLQRLAEEALQPAAPLSLALEIALEEERLRQLTLARPTPPPPPRVDTGLDVLSEEQEAAVQQALAPAGPPLPVKGKFCAFGESEVTRENMACMRPGIWLNDEAINFYLALLHEREFRDAAAAKRAAPRVHFFSTFFYAKLFQEGGGYCYKNVARWTSAKKLKYCVLDCDLAVMPVHQGMHWCLAVLDLRARTVTYYDSLFGEDHDCVANLARWLDDEAADKGRKPLSPLVRNWPRLYPKDIPQQKNGCDCGVFMLMYADWLARNLPFAFSQEDMPGLRRRIVAELLALRVRD